MYIKSSIVWLLLICFAFSLKSASAKMRAILTKVECHTYGEILQNASCVINQTLPNSLSVELLLNKDLNVINGHILLTGQRGSVTTDYISIDLDYCELLAAQHNNYVIRIVSNNVRKSSNFPVNCPFKMNKRYYVKEYTLELGQLPSYIPEFDFISNLKFNYNKKLFLHFILNGRILRN